MYTTRIRSLMGSLFSSNIFLGIVVFTLYLVGTMRYIELPGLYMDTINSDHLAAEIINGKNNPQWVIPNLGFYFLPGCLYRGLVSLYTGLPIYYLLGFTVPAARISHSIPIGATMVVAYFLLKNMTRNRVLTWLPLFCMATSLPILVANRTQSHHLFWGLPFLFGSMLLMFRIEESRNISRTSFFIGLLYGIAVYTYFIYWFFFPAILISFLIGYRRSKLKRLWFAILGGTLGLSPFILAYVSLYISVGGFHNFIDYLLPVVTKLEPVSNDRSLWGNLIATYQNISGALGNGPMEQFVLGVGSTPSFLDQALDLSVFGGHEQRNVLPRGYISDMMVWLWVVFLAIIGFKALPLVTLEVDRNYRKVIFFILLPISYCLFGIFIFGDRLWVHHYSIIIPFFILTIPLVLCPSGIPKYLTRLSKYRNISAIFIIICIISFNALWQNDFFRTLNKTGGSRLFSNNLTLFAEEAKNETGKPLFLFPEWGFYMPFCFLTENLIPFEHTSQINFVRVNEESLDCVRLAFWNENDEAKYREILYSQGVINLAIKKYFSRDQRLVFCVLEGELKQSYLNQYNLKTLHEEGLYLPQYIIGAYGIEQEGAYAWASDKILFKLSPAEGPVFFSGAIPNTSGLDYSGLNFKIYLNDELFFDKYVQKGEAFNIELPTSSLGKTVTDQVLNFKIVTDHYFVPALIGSGNDMRRLSYIIHNIGGTED